MGENMCSIFKYNNIVGRNFDYEVSYDEELRVIDRDERNFKIIGMCTGAVKDYPLLYDGMNECGLVCGGLAFTGNAEYFDEKFDGINIPSYDFPLFILSHHQSVREVKELLENLNITNKPYLDKIPPSDLHWFIADKEESIIVEQTKNGLNVYGGDVMTNNPIYPIQKHEYETFKDLIGDTSYYKNIYNTRGMETSGLDGAYTSDGRFERLSYLKEKLEESDNSFDDISQGFHLLSSVEQIYGATPVKDKFEYTIYSIVYDMENLKVYLKGYDDLTIMEKSL